MRGAIEGNERVEMIEASTQFMVGRLSTESGKCNSLNLDGIFGNDKHSLRDQEDRIQVDINHSVRSMTPGLEMSALISVG